ncbi:MAG: histidinol dehydrogenase [Fibrobacter sp.]|jgi:histidinol dehydrogenase|nr:histidinol dehydrogenase [Fibrobacter sp.]
MKIVEVKPDSSEISRLCSRTVAPTVGILKKVQEIIADVQNGGIEKALYYAKEFDSLKTDSLRVDAKEIEGAASLVSDELKNALDLAILNVKSFHEHQQEKSWSFEASDGVVLGQRIRPMHRVGLYVPGGSGAYPSTVIMNAVPAMIAGVQEIVVVTPIKDKLNPALAYVLKSLSITEVYHIGGAQAIALLAYGAEGVAPVDKIVGPGNVFATIAKKEVFGVVDIDMIAGPSEILVMADATANPEYVAADLLSQAEHGSGFEASICITNDLDTAQSISAAVKEQVEASPKKDLLYKSLEVYGRILLVKNWEDGVQIANHIAPEHLEIITENAALLSEKIVNAGAIFIGPYSSEPVGDYFAGPNHVLPTNGTARFFSPLGVYDFIKRTSVIEYSKEAIQKHAKSIASIAESEGFIHHAAAVLKRLEE